MYFTKNTSVTIPFIFAEAETHNDPSTTVVVTPANVTFDEAQKNRIKEIVAERVGETHAKNRKEFEEAMKKQHDEFEAKFTELASRKPDGTGDGDKEAEFKRVLADQKKALKDREEQLHVKAKEVEERDRMLAQVKKDVALRNAASKLNFANVDMVLKLTGDSVSLDADSGQYIVRNEDGHIIQGDDMRNIKLEDYFAKFAEANPYLVKSDARGGAGSRVADNLLSGSVRSMADLSDPKRRNDWIEKNGIAAFAKLPPK